MKKSITNGELRCCGKKSQLYKSRSIYYCHKCHYHYDLNGNSLGYFGRGITKEQWYKEAAEFAKANGYTK